MKDLSRDLGIAMVIITHNLGIVARYADRVNVMYAARLAEQGSAADVFAKPLHPYTAGLLRSVPRLDQPRGLKLETIEGLPPNLLEPPPGCRFAPRCPAQQDACVAAPPPLVEVEPHRYSACVRAREMAQVGPTGLGLAEREPAAAGAQGARHGAAAAEGARPANLLRGRRRPADVQERATSRCARWTGSPSRCSAARRWGWWANPAAARPRSAARSCGSSRRPRGEIVFEGANVTRAQGQQLKDYRRKIQVIFQDPYSSLNPRMTIGEIIAEPMRVYRLVPTARRRARRWRSC